MFFFLMRRRPPRSTRTDTLFPYTTLFRSLLALSVWAMLQYGFKPSIDFRGGTITEVKYEGSFPTKGQIEVALNRMEIGGYSVRPSGEDRRSEEHTSELQSLMRISYAVCCLNKQITYQHTTAPNQAHN